MTLNEVKERLATIVDALPPGKAELLLDFAAFLKQQFQREPQPLQPTTPENEFDVWEQELIAAEEYWFSLPEATRRTYLGKTVAVLKARIIDADESLPALRRRVAVQYPDQTVLFVEADEERLAPLILRSPRFG